MTCVAVSLSRSNSFTSTSIFRATLFFHWEVFNNI